MKSDPKDAVNKNKTKKLFLKNMALAADDIRKAILELITINGRPRELLNDSGFRLILDPLLEALPEEELKKLCDI